MKCPLTRRSIEFLNRFLKTKVEVPNFNNLQRLLFDIIFRNSTISRIDYGTLSDGEMVRLLFCQKLLLKDYFVKEII